MKETKTNKGITLIALVITIIVMLILVAVTISMAINGGLFDYAGKAVGETQNAIDKEAGISNGQITVDGETYASIDDYLAGKPTTEKFSEIYDETTEYTDKNGKKAWIPAGFAVGTSTGINTVDKGLVITDAVDEAGKSTGNEYVWIPVPEGTFVRESFGDTALSTAYTETIPEAMETSVSTRKGFYIGRYEAGSTAKRESSSVTLTTPLSKKSVFVYNFVSYSNAVSEVAKLYTADTYGVIATLPYGAQWDSMLRFLSSEVNVTNSTSWGNYRDAEFAFNGEYLDCTIASAGTWIIPDGEEIKPENSIYLLKTGVSERNKVKNIYDVAGNVSEWTNEADSSSFRVYRGGNFDSNGSNRPASGRISDHPDNSNYFVGFRVALYIN